MKVAEKPKKYLQDIFLITVFMKARDNKALIKP